LEGASIKEKVRSKRLRDLYHELFYNLSYFNLIAVAPIVVPTGLLLPTLEVPGFLRGLGPVTMAWQVEGVCGGERNLSKLPNSGLRIAERQQREAVCALNSVRQNCDFFPQCR
jgi:hypothetical protein